MGEVGESEAAPPCFVAPAHQSHGHGRGHAQMESQESVRVLSHEERLQVAFTLLSTLPSAVWILSYSDMPSSYTWVACVCVRVHACACVSTGGRGTDRHSAVSVTKGKQQRSGHGSPV